MLLLFIVLLQSVFAIDYSLNGANWDGDCITGTQQSPIDIVTSSTEKDDTISFDVSKSGIYNSVPVNISGLQVRALIGEQSEWKYVSYSKGDSEEEEEDVKFDLIEMTWNTPSEHTIDGVQYDAELQLVHKNEND